MDSSTLLDKILDSIFYNTSKKKASKLSQNSVGILALLKRVLNKINVEGKSNVLNAAKNKILTLGKLLKFYATGEYRSIDLKNIIIIITAFVYLISPIDLIPDFIPMLGLADDVALITFVFNSVSEEIEKFETWLLNRDIS